MVSARKIHCANLTDTHFVGKENVAIIRKSKEKNRKTFHAGLPLSSAAGKDQTLRTFLISSEH